MGDELNLLLVRWLKADGTISDARVRVRRQRVQSELLACLTWGAPAGSIEAHLLDAEGLQVAALQVLHRRASPAQGAPPPPLPPLSLSRAHALAALAARPRRLHSPPALAACCPCAVSPSRRT